MLAETGLPAIHFLTLRLGIQLTGFVCLWTAQAVFPDEYEKKNELDRYLRLLNLLNMRKTLY